jgi:hypothetical protein
VDSARRQCLIRITINLRWARTELISTVIGASTKLATEQLLIEAEGKIMEPPNIKRTPRRRLKLNFGHASAADAGVKSQ